MSSQTKASSQLPEPKLSLKRQWSRDQAISYLMQQAVENPDVISLAAGLVDTGSLPVEETRLAVADLLADDARCRQVLQYGTTAGADRLRNLLLDHFARLEGCARENLGIDVDQLVLTTGSQQFLSLVGEVLVDPGDICLVAAPTYFVFLGVVHGLGARAVPVATDEDGMRPDALEATLQSLESNGDLDRVKLIYLVSYFENPSGYTLSLDRREEMVRICRDWSKHQRIFILEDTAYRELQYEGTPLPSVWSFDSTCESVILAQTFSKSFSPGLRVGFGIAPASLIDAICDRKGNEDFGSPNFNQHVMATVLENGLYESHVRKVREAYRTKRDCMLAAADAYFSDLPGVHWMHPQGGLYVWMTLPEAIETGFDSPLFHRATRVEKVMYVPGELCYAGEPGRRPRNQLRLSYGVEDPHGIELGMQRLANALRAEMQA